MVNNFTLNVMGDEVTFHLGTRKELLAEGWLGAEDHQGTTYRYKNHIAVTCDPKEYDSIEEANECFRQTLDHEIFHLYVQKSALDLDDNTEEQLATWMGVMARKMRHTQSEVLCNLKGKDMLPFTEDMRID